MKLTQLEKNVIKNILEKHYHNNLFYVIDSDASEGKQQVAQFENKAIKKFINNLK